MADTVPEASVDQVKLEVDLPQDATVTPVQHCINVLKDCIGEEYTGAWAVSTAMLTIHEATMNISMFNTLALLPNTTVVSDIAKHFPKWWQQDIVTRKNLDKVLRLLRENPKHVPLTPTEMAAKCINAMKARAVELDITISDNDAEQIRQSWLSTFCEAVNTNEPRFDYLDVYDMIELTELPEIIVGIKTITKEALNDGVTQMKVAEPATPLRKQPLTAEQRATVLVERLGKFVKQMEEKSMKKQQEEEKKRLEHEQEKKMKTEKARLQREQLERNQKAQKEQLERMRKEQEEANRKREQEQKIDKERQEKEQKKQREEYELQCQRNKEEQLNKERQEKEQQQKLQEEYRKQLAERIDTINGRLKKITGLTAAEYAKQNTPNSAVSTKYPSITKMEALAKKRMYLTSIRTEKRELKLLDSAVDEARCFKSSSTNATMFVPMENRVSKKVIDAIKADADVVEAIQKGADVNEYDRDAWNKNRALPILLMKSSFDEAKINIMKMILSQEDIDLSCPNNIMPNTYLPTVFEKERTTGNVNCRYLCDLTTENNKGSEQDSMFRMLLDMGVDPKEAVWETVAHCVYNAKKEDEDSEVILSQFLVELIQYGFNPNEKLGEGAGSCSKDLTFFEVLHTVIKCKFSSNSSASKLWSHNSDLKQKLYFGYNWNNMGQTQSHLGTYSTKDFACALFELFDTVELHDVRGELDQLDLEFEESKKATQRARAKLERVEACGCCVIA